MAHVLLSGDTHHELLVFEGLLALTNIASCQQGHSLTKLPCGDRKGGDGQARPLHKVLTQELLYEKNPRIQLATCELLANLSLTSEFQEMAQENDEEQDG